MPARTRSLRRPREVLQATLRTTRHSDVRPLLANRIRAMLNSPTMNRLRHIARRVREVPVGFLVQKARLTVRPYLFWATYAWRAKRHGRTPRVPVRDEFVGHAMRVRAALHAYGEVAANRTRITARARALVDGPGFPCLGYGSIPLPTGRSWHCDLTTGFDFGAEYFPRVGFLTHGADADVKVPWELSRLQWLVWLAEDALVVGDAERALRLEALWERWEDWAHSNPAGFGPAWAIAMEVAIRSINLVLVALLLWVDLTREQRQHLLASLEEHRSFLRRFPELSDHLGNHFLVGRTAEIVLDGLLFSVGGGDNDNRAVEPILEQFGEDGLHVEHAPLYHRLCTEALLWVVAVRSWEPAGVPAPIAKVAARACRAIQGLELSESIGLPVLGDADSGQVYLEGESTRRLGYLRGLLGITADAPPHLQALARPGALENLRMLLAAPSATAQVGGGAERIGPYCVLRRRQWTIAVRAGAHGLRGRASHDHDDNASPWICCDGSDVLVDAGCFAYTRSANERLHDLSSAAHNVVVVDGRSRFRPRAGSMSPTVADAPVPHSVSALPHGVEIEVAWEDSVVGRVVHRRTIQLTNDLRGVQIEDRCRMALPAPLMLRWHIGPDWVPEVGPDLVTLRHRTLRRVVVLYSHAEGATLGAYSSTTSRFSPRYGARELLHSLAARTSAASDILVRTRLQLADE